MGSRASIFLESSDSLLGCSRNSIWITGKRVPGLAQQPQCNRICLKLLIKYIITFARETPHCQFSEKNKHSILVFDWLKLLRYTGSCVLNGLSIGNEINSVPGQKCDVHVSTLRSSFVVDMNFVCWCTWHFYQNWNVWSDTSQREIINPKGNFSGNYKIANLSQNLSWIITRQGDSMHVKILTVNSERKTVAAYFKSKEHHWRTCIVGQAQLGNTSSSQHCWDCVAWMGCKHMRSQLECSWSIYSK